MSNKKVNIEELYRSHFEGFTVEPSPGMWSRVYSSLRLNRFMRFSLNTFNIYYAAAIIALATIGIILFNRPDAAGVDAMEQQQEQSAAQPSSIDQSVPVLKENEQQAGEAKTGQSTTVSPVQDNKSETALTAESFKLKGTELKDKQGKTKPGETTQLPDGKDRQSKLNEPVTVVAAFEISNKSGCSPLAVNFNNLSENASSYLWTFGDGGSSQEKNPSYVFDEPGEYNVSLKITGTDEVEYTSMKTVMVHPTPKAQFEFDEDVSLANGQPVYFYNYSRDADFYLWDFGDRSMSTLAEPSHYYEAPGQYNIKLKAWTKNQCYDSLIVLNAFSDIAAGIVFPNAFSPNMNGPSGGYYTLNDPNNAVFHPIVNGDILEYQLRIFNRLGVQVFESNDVQTGWDGYFENKLSLQGVYIWKARGRFANGKTFVKSGDVTLIWSR